MYKVRGAIRDCRAAYIDGMPLLMAASTTRMWDDLVRRNFAGPVMRFFRMGATTVVLAFDDYKHVPAAKSITQANRSKGKAAFVFNDRQNLETVMPADYNERLCNRAYKRRVIDLVAETVADQARLREGQRLVIDYVDCPVLFQHDPAQGKITHTYLDTIPPMGECDVKFTRWARMLGDLIAYSVDGDFIPIALMEYERQSNALMEADPALRGGRPQRRPPSIAIFRMECKMAADRPARQRAAAASSGKRDRHGRPVTLTASGGRIVVTGADDGQAVRVAGAGPLPAAAPTEAKANRGPRVMEYVNVPLLFQALSSAMAQCEPTRCGASRGGKAGARSDDAPGVGQAGARSDDACGAPGVGQAVARSDDACGHALPGARYMRMIAALIALTGTDFTRKLPQLTPKKVWEVLPVRTVWDSLQAAYDPERSELRVGTACDGLVAAMYALKFCNHVPTPCPGTIDGVVAALARSKLSEKTKAQIPSRARVEATIKNANWLLQYWECRQPSPAPPPQGEAKPEEGEAWDYTRCYPDPVCDEYGFKAARGRKAAVKWLDEPD